MRRREALLLSIILGGCGYVGDPLPPALNIPEKVIDLRAVQRGSKIVAEFTIPALTTEKLPLASVESVDLRAGSGGFDPAGWAASAKPYPTEFATPGLAKVEIPVADWIGKEIVIAVRIQHLRGRFSEWSSPVVLPVVEPLEAPSNVRANSVNEGVRVTWNAPSGLTFRVYRQESSEKEAIPAGTVSANEFIDSIAAYGKSYRYSVQSLRMIGDREAESEISPIASITHEDKFPPAIPSGLAAVAGNGIIELAWRPSRDADLAGYSVYKAIEGGEFIPLADLVESTSYSDKSVEPGRRYRYAVASVDSLKNESGRSEPVEIVAQ